MAVTRYLGKEGIDIYAIGNSKNNLASLSKYCKNTFIGPNLEQEDAYAQFIIDLIKKNHFDLLIPVSIIKMGDPAYTKLSYDVDNTIQ